MKDKIIHLESIVKNYKVGTQIVRALRSVSFHREFNQRAFLGEKVDISLEIYNRNWLPVPWLELRENLPVELAFHPQGAYGASHIMGNRHSEKLYHAGFRINLYLSNLGAE